jgi:hypothetical protein
VDSVGYNAGKIEHIADDRCCTYRLDLMGDLERGEATVDWYIDRAGEPGTEHRGQRRITIGDNAADRLAGFDSALADRSGSLMRLGPHLTESERPIGGVHDEVRLVGGMSE